MSDSKEEKKENESNGDIDERDVMSPLGFKFACSFMFIGDMHSGKTFLAAKILKTCKIKFDKVFIVTTTNEFSNDFDDLEGLDCDDIEIVNEFSESKLAEQIEEQKERKRGDIKSQSAVLIDDAVTNQLSADVLKRSLALREIIAQGRHWGLSVFWLVQDFLDLATKMRKLCQLNFVFKVTRKQAEQIAESFNKTMKKWEFMAWCLAPNETEHGCLLINKPENTLEFVNCDDLLKKNKGKTFQQVLQETLDNMNPASQFSSRENEEVGEREL